MSQRRCKDKKNREASYENLDGNLVTSMQDGRRRLRH